MFATMPLPVITLVILIGWQVRHCSIPVMSLPFVSFTANEAFTSKVNGEVKWQQCDCGRCDYVQFT